MTRPIRMRGIPASPGIAVAEARVVDRQHIRIPRRRLDPAQVARETDRLQAAVEEARRQIDAARRAITGGDGGGHGNHTLILEAHLLMLGDEQLIGGAFEVIASQRVNAEWALQRKLEDAVTALSGLEDEYLRERTQDVDFVVNRVLRNLLGHGAELLVPECEGGRYVVVTGSLSPAETAQMVGSSVVALATEQGTLTSHTAIMAQALGIPAVLGVERLLEHLDSGDMLIVDGDAGVVVIRPDAELVEEYRARDRELRARDRRLKSIRDRPAVTADGVDIALWGNIELPAEAPLALEYGAEGIGLYRTEFLYLNREDPPSEDEQYETYLAMVRTLAPRTVVFRTFDLGADKLPGIADPRECNPALGLRAIRFGLSNRALFRTQLRALLRVAARQEAWIMFPMISGVEELRQVKALLAEVRSELGAAAPDVVRIGCMIETPAAVFVADRLAREADFFSIGTNDLIQYALAIDRLNEQVAYLYTPYHPAILRAIRMVVAAASAAGIHLSICGSVASEPSMAPLLLGLGIRTLSLAPAAIPRVKNVIRALDLRLATVLTRKLLDLDTAVAVEDRVREFIERHVEDPDVFAN
jgi:phosphotransferase system enzyme I (PtsI)